MVDIVDLLGTAFERNLESRSAASELVLGAERICESNLTDALALAPKHCQACFVAPAGEIVARAFYDASARLYLIRCNKRAVALLAFSSSRIKCLLVDAAAQHCGIGSALLAALVAAAASTGSLVLSLGVSARNYAAQRLYLRSGFVFTGLSPDSMSLEMSWTGAIWPPALPAADPQQVLCVFHVTGAVGVGKTELGERIRTCLPSIAVVDIDAIFESLSPDIQDNGLCACFYLEFNRRLDAARKAGRRVVLAIGLMDEEPPCTPARYSARSLANYTGGCPAFVLTVPRQTQVSQYYLRTALALLDSASYIDGMLAGTHELLSLRELDKHTSDLTDALTRSGGVPVSADELFARLAKFAALQTFDAPVSTRQTPDLPA